MITCPTPGCGAVLREIEGVHSPGDAPLILGPGNARSVRCLKCKKLIAWPTSTPKAARSNVIPLLLY
jgi:hypothetical protein